MIRSTNVTIDVASPIYKIDARFKKEMEFVRKYYSQDHRYALFIKSFWSNEYANDYYIETLKKDKKENSKIKISL